MGREQRLLGMVSLLAGLALILPGVGHARTAAGMSWAHPTTIDRDENATPMGVTCPSAGLCLAYDDAGRVLVSSQPTGGASSWKVHQVDPASWALEGISCPSKSLCVVYNKQGTIFASRNPGARASRWVRMAADHDGLNSLSCPSVSLCVGVDDAGNAIGSTGPGRRGSWKLASLGDASPTSGCEHYQVDPCTERSLRDVSCTAPALCVALDQAGNVIASTNPAGGASAWHVVFAEAVDSNSALSSIACPSRTFCAGVDGWGNFVVSEQPTDGQSAWRTTGVNTGGMSAGPHTVDTTNMLTSVVCPARSICLGIDGDGALITTTNAAAAVPVWRHALPLELGLTVTCSANLWCFALDGEGDLYTSPNPTSGRFVWSRAHPDNSLAQPDFGLPPLTPLFSCPSSRFCLTVDQIGRILIGQRHLLPARPAAATHGTPFVRAQSRTRSNRSIAR
jgi:hypothetical protein